ncbi:hypothetical protein [Clavibacter tessellarius]|uniref:hypothetical protein n=1 Tax=Clavibacter tessellarius TaxID=31965 RepID=UPI0032513DEA
MTDRILTTHAGSLPRSPELTRLLVARDQGRPFDAAELAEVTATSVADTVRRQLETGLDVVNDGEVPRVGFSTYVLERIDGFGGAGHRKPTLDSLWFPDYAAFQAKQIVEGADVARVWDPPVAQGLLAYDPTLAGITEDLDGFDRETRRAGGPGPPTRRHVLLRRDPGHRLHDPAARRREPALRRRPRLRLRARRPAQARVRRDRRARPRPPARRARPRDGARHPVRRRHARGVPRGGRPARGRAQPRDPRHPARGCACTSAGATGRARTRTTCPSTSCSRTCTGRTWVRSASRSGTRRTSTRRRRSATTRCPRAPCSSRASWT